MSRRIEKMERALVRGRIRSRGGREGDDDEDEDEDEGGARSV